MVDKMYKANILIVEDESIEAMSFEQSLKSSGYDVVGIASAGEDALKKAADLEPDLILMDIVLKGDMDGIEVAAQIKEVFDIPVIYLTAHPEESVVNRAKLTSPYGYLIKPVNKTDLKNTIELALYKHDMEIKLKKSENKYRSIVENVLDSYFRGDTEGRIIMASPSAARMYRYDSPQDMIGIPALSLYKSPEERENILEELEKHGKVQNMEVRSLRKDGSTFWVSMNVQYYYDEQGKIQGTEGFIRDITESKMADKELRESETGVHTDITDFKPVEDVLRESEKKFKDLAELLPQTVFETDEKGFFTFANQIAFETFGFTQNDLNKEISLLKLLVPEDQQRAMENVQKVFKGEKLGAIEYTALKKNKTRFPVLTYTDAIFDENKPVGLRGILLDLTEYKMADEGLRESEEKYKTLVEISPEAVTSTDLEGYITYVSNRTLTLHGYNNPKDLIGKNSLELISPEFHEEAIKILKKTLKEGYSGYHEYKFLKKDGSTFIGELHASLIKDRDGSPKAFMATTTDITERKKAEFALKKSEEKYRSWFENDLAGDFIATPEGKILECNHAFAEIYGFSNLKKAVQSDISEFNHDAWKNLIKHLKTEHKLYNNQFTQERPDGKQIHVVANVLGVFNESGELLQIKGYIFDDTERKKAEEDRKASEEKYRLVVETAAEGIGILDTKGTILDINEKALEMSGFNRDELIGKNFIRIVPRIKMDSKLLLSIFKGLILGKTSSATDWTMINKQGEQVTFVAHLSSLRKGKKIIGQSFILEDITDRKKAEEKLEKSLEEKNLLLKEIHHRVKNNLQIISSLLELQQEYVKDDLTAVNVLKESQNRVLSMAMLHEMLYQSKDLSHINFSDYIKNLISNLLYSYSTKNNIKPIISVENIFLNIETSVPCGLIISELVSNSLKYAYPNNKTGELSISLKSLNKEFELIISDNGIGFPEELDFRNIESSLGLKLVNSLVNQLDGSIELDRSQGTEFTIKFKELKYKTRI